MNQSDSLQGDSGQSQADIQNELLEIKRSLFSIFLALLPVGLTVVLMVFESSVPGRTLGELDYAITPYLAFLVIALTVGGLVFWHSYLGQFWGIAWFSVLGLVPMLASQNMAIDAWNRRDDSAPIVRRVTVINQVGHSYKTKKYGSGTAYVLEVTSWREGEETLSFSVDHFLPEMTRGRQVCIEERPGRLGRSWISEPRFCADE